MDKLRKAVQKGAVEDVRSLVFSGADVNALDKKGVNALHVAAEMNDLELLEALLESPKADVNIADVQGWTPIVHCLCASGGDLSILRRLLKVPNCSVNTPDLDGNTALHWAAMLNQPEAAELLINRGAHRNAVNNAKETPLHVALKEGNEETVEMLVEKNVDVNAKSADGKTPLLIALSLRQVNLAHRLLQSGKLDLEANVDNEGNTPIHLAVMEGLEGFAEKLVAGGFSPDVRNLAGYTAEELRAQQLKEAEEKAERQTAAKEERELRRRQQAEQEMRQSEVSVFCRNYGLPDSVAEILYKKKFRYLDDAFFDLSSAMLKKFGLSNDEREKLEQAREDYLAKSEREKAAALEAIEKTMARRRTLLRLLGFVVVAIIFLMLYFGLEIFIARDSRKRR
ncbi:Serine/threonine-protein phosphatase 6 regulatory ankyrin repeat subunit B, related [Neospora caninum Liverpool]|uniref:Serine/threonine-protein phosphatase 6 regulatory ankyrin repeat subunit B, related n=1 Tax=Neospora caninum (strain Liverpool) TaxID=572307 RepID=F0VP88_NEOCL|nr:Serine/threonine-protein phosphatase 6 regulatory ankyrin repeat subunit B, related [Neospora caninum Liverpool]CBZ55534.1 Serine/threonine-protein phosphatase 6 regulatory ankyrin repeat subunit B, related [Neospora caninum Liverpool]CEL70274.1 TPA: Serine/threonine-protein phosphatase 6 regulatory ankyrin repeat subunit B, related [Neospora caninum Liverpool]|eukprot:XP_003885562.1 Serine/threonine-protein phosphatase 6 regulatory ankyrin repeat subunit B, related [Neospora caninum Liverpool]